MSGNVDYPDRVFFGNVVIEEFGQQRGLGSTLALDESAHAITLHQELVGITP
jgi:hypothetical protein